MRRTTHKPPLAPASRAARSPRSPAPRARRYGKPREGGYDHHYFTPAEIADDVVAAFGFTVKTSPKGAIKSPDFLAILKHMNKHSVAFSSDEDENDDEDDDEDDGKKDGEEEEEEEEEGAGK